MWGKKKESEKEPEKRPEGNMATGEGFSSIRWHGKSIRVLDLEDKWSYADLDEHLSAGWQVVVTYVYSSMNMGGNRMYRLILSKSPQDTQA